MTWFDYDEQNLSRFLSVSFANKGFCLIEVSVKKELPVVVKWRHRANNFNIWEMNWSFFRAKVRLIVMKL